MNPTSPAFVLARPTEPNQLASINTSVGSGNPSPVGQSQPSSTRIQVATDKDIGTVVTLTGDQNSELLDEFESSFGEKKDYKTLDLGVLGNMCEETNVNKDAKKQAKSKKKNSNNSKVSNRTSNAKGKVNNRKTEVVSDNKDLILPKILSCKVIDPPDSKIDVHQSIESLTRDLEGHGKANQIKVEYETTSKTKLKKTGNIKKESNNRKSNNNKESNSRKSNKNKSYFVEDCVEHVESAQKSHKRTKNNVSPKKSSPQEDGMNLRRSKRNTAMKKSAEIAETKGDLKNNAIHRNKSKGKSAKLKNKTSNDSNLSDRNNNGDILKNQVEIPKQLTQAEELDLAVSAIVDHTDPCLSETGGEVPSQTNMLKASFNNSVESEVAEALVTLSEVPIVTPVKKAPKHIDEIPETGRKQQSEDSAAKVPSDIELGNDGRDNISENKQQTNSPESNVEYKESNTKGTNTRDTKVIENANLVIAPEKNMQKDIERNDSCKLTPVKQKGFVNIAPHKQNPTPVKRKIFVITPSKANVTIVSDGDRKFTMVTPGKENVVHAQNNKNIAQGETVNNRPQIKIVDEKSSVEVTQDENKHELRSPEEHNLDFITPKKISSLVPYEFSSGSTTTSTPKRHGTPLFSPKGTSPVPKSPYGFYSSPFINTQHGKSPMRHIMISPQRSPQLQQLIKLSTIEQLKRSASKKSPRKFLPRPNFSPARSQPLNHLIEASIIDMKSQLEKELKCSENMENKSDVKTIIKKPDAPTRDSVKANLMSKFRESPVQPSKQVHFQDGTTPGKSAPGHLLDDPTEVCQRTSPTVYKRRADRVNDAEQRKKVINVMQYTKTRLFSLKWDSELLYYSTRGCL